MVAIRGATTILYDSKDEVIQNTKVLLENIIKKNNIQKKHIISIIFSSTIDIKSCYPAICARQMGLDKVALMCFNEMYVENSLKMCIRVALYTNLDINQDDVRHVYLNDAISLRPDL